jgi:hypothetical protein
MLLVVTPEKPFPRAAKGTVNRKAALADFAIEIDQM